MIILKHLGTKTMKKIILLALLPLTAFAQSMDDVVIEPAPPVICPDGSRGACSPVNDWWCSVATACKGTIEVSFGEVYAPASLSPLGIEQPWHDHWYACRDWTRVLEDQLATMEPPPPALPEIKACVPFADGVNRGRLWKPISESTGKLVVLMPEEYRNENPVIEDIAGNVLSRVTRKSCCANGNRAHFWFDKYASQLPSMSRLVIRGECYEVSNPSARVD